MFSSVFAAFKDLVSVKSVNVLCKAVFFTVLSYVLAFTLAYVILQQVNLLSIMWLDRILDAAGLIFTAIIGFFILPSILSMFAEFFAEDAIDNTEAKLFSVPPAKNKMSFWDYLFVSVGTGLKSLFFTLGLGILYLIFSPLMAFMLTPLAVVVLCPLTYWIANGFVLSSGFYDTVSMRYLKPMDSAELWEKRKFGFIFIGVMCSFMYTVPLLNFLTPIYSYSLTTRYFWKAYNRTFGSNVL